MPNFNTKQPFEDSVTDFLKTSLMGYYLLMILKQEQYMDQLDIIGLSLSTRIGIHAWEQRIQQKLMVDISIPMDFTQCQNNLKNTIDYDALTKRVTSFVEDNSFELIETVAEKIATLVKEEFKVSKVIISVSKPDAIKNASNIRVTLTR